LPVFRPPDQFFFGSSLSDDPCGRDGPYRNEFALSPFTCRLCIGVSVMLLGQSFLSPNASLPSATAGWSLSPPFCPVRISHRHLLSRPFLFLPFWLSKLCCRPLSGFFPSFLLSRDSACVHRCTPHSLSPPCGAVGSLIPPLLLRHF